MLRVPHKIIFTSLYTFPPFPSILVSLSHSFRIIVRCAFCSSVSESPLTTLSLFLSHTHSETRNASLSLVSSITQFNSSITAESWETGGLQFQASSRIRRLIRRNGRSRTAPPTATLHHGGPHLLCPNKHRP